MTSESRQLPRAISTIGRCSTSVTTARKASLLWASISCGETCKQLQANADEKETARAAIAADTTFTCAAPRGRPEPDSLLRRPRRSGPNLFPETDASEPDRHTTSRFDTDSRTAGRADDTDRREREHSRSGRDSQDGAAGRRTVRI